jgi:hypothetical protein
MARGDVTARSIARLKVLHGELDACRACPKMIGPVVHGPAVESGILLVGQAPGPREGGFGKPFAWTAGRTLFRWMEGIGVGGGFAPGLHGGGGPVLQARPRRVTAPGRRRDQALQGLPRARWRSSDRRWAPVSGWPSSRSSRKAPGRGRRPLAAGRLSASGDVISLPPERGVDVARWSRMTLSARPGLIARHPEVKRAFARSPGRRERFLVAALALAPVVSSDDRRSGGDGDGSAAIRAQPPRVRSPPWRGAGEAEAETCSADGQRWGAPRARPRKPLPGSRCVAPRARPRRSEGPAPRRVGRRVAERLVGRVALFAKSVGPAARRTPLLARDAPQLPPALRAGGFVTALARLTRSRRSRPSPYSGIPRRRPRGGALRRSGRRGSACG